MTLRIVTDSTCDLPESVIEEHGIRVIPMYINAAGESYQDGVDLPREEFYRRLPEFDPAPTTAAPGPEVFRQAYEQLAEEGASEILSIHISKSLSAVLDVATIAAGQTDRIPVTVVDSRQLSLGTGFLVQLAAQEAARGRSREDVLARLGDQIERTNVFAALDTMEFLRRSGRVSSLVAGFGNLLQIKPLLKMYDGNPTSERVRTSNGATNRILQLLEGCTPLERVALVHTHSPERAEKLLDQVRDLLPEGEILSVDITPVIGAHIGPGAVGFACVSSSGSQGEE
jgi:DegV family protein with EDD domain